MRSLKEIKEGKEIRNYNCGWCEHKFTQAVGSISSSSGNPNKTGHNGVSDQVKCPNCNNFLKTYN